MKILLIWFLLFPGIICAQQREVKVLTYNVGFGGLSAGLGAVLNKKKGENWKRSFVRGWWQGSIGGVLNYSGKKTIHLIDKNNNLGYALPARLLSAAGNSIIQNAAYNSPFLKNWNLEYGFFHFDFVTGSGRNFSVRLLPLSVVSTALLLPKGKLDVRTSLFTGTMALKSKKPISTINGRHSGVNYGRAFIYQDDTLQYHLIAHELTHEYQYREYLVFNAYLKKPAAKLKETRAKKFFAKYIYPDIPYFGLFYALEGVQQGPRFYRNYFEYEAEKFGTNL